jgi:hypothetical protein
VGELTVLPRVRSPEAALGVLDELRQQVLDGRVIAFCAVAIEPDDTTTAWASCTQHVTRLRMQGAIASLMHHYVAGDVCD